MVNRYRSIFRTNHLLNIDIHVTHSRFTVFVFYCNVTIPGPLVYVTSDRLGEFSLCGSKPLLIPLYLAFSTPKRLEILFRYFIGQVQLCLYQTLLSSYCVIPCFLICLAWTYPDSSLCAARRPPAPIAQLCLPYTN